MPYLMGSVNHTDWQARKATIQAVKLLVQSVSQKEMLMEYKTDLVRLLHPAKSDKFKPVREAAGDALAQVRLIPEPLNQRHSNLATFSPH